MTGIVIKKHLETDTHTGEHHVTRKTEIGVMLLQAKELQRLPANLQKTGERQRTNSPSASEGTTLPPDF